MADYALLLRQTQALAEDAPAPLAVLANVTAMLWEALPCLNWCGFYLHDGSQRMVLGPFQGKAACQEIPFGRGVCGTAAATKQLQLVPDVHAFPGHIACDCASNSEIVIPLLLHDQVLGVLDIDSPELGRFTETDAEGLQAIANVLTAALDWQNGLLGRQRS